jgi:hypothetical protein
VFKFVYLSISAGSLDPARRFHNSSDRLTGILLVWLVSESAFEARKSIAKTNREVMEYNQPIVSAASTHGAGIDAETLSTRMVRDSWKMLHRLDVAALASAISLKGMTDVAGYWMACLAAACDPLTLRCCVPPVSQRTFPHLLG